MSRRNPRTRRPSITGSLSRKISGLFFRSKSDNDSYAQVIHEGMLRGPGQVVGTYSTPQTEPYPHTEPVISEESEQFTTPPPTIRRRTSSPRSSGSQSRFWPIFWTLSGSLSLLLNLILILALLSVGRELFVLKQLVSDELLSGLYQNFVLMDDATITTSVHVKKDIPVSFNLPLEQDTVVVLTQDTPIYGANVALSSGGVFINSPADIILPVGQQLPVSLRLSVPVSISVPVELDVPVSIPLSSTELHEPLLGLREVINQFYEVTLPNIQSPKDLPFCEKFPGLCELYFK